MKSSENTSLGCIFQERSALINDFIFFSLPFFSNFLSFKTQYKFVRNVRGKNVVLYQLRVDLIPFTSYFACSQDDMLFKVFSHIQKV